VWTILSSLVIGGKKDFFFWIEDFEQERANLKFCLLFVDEMKKKQWREQQANNKFFILFSKRQNKFN
jgi:hypothetical protein